MKFNVNEDLKLRVTLELTEHEADVVFGWMEQIDTKDRCVKILTDHIAYFKLRKRQFNDNAVKQPKDKMNGY